MRKVRALKPSKTGQKVTGRGLRSHTEGQGELEGESKGCEGEVEDTKEVDKRNEAPSHTVGIASNCLIPASGFSRCFSAKWE